jgi:hypothetical protein
MLGTARLVRLLSQMVNDTVYTYLQQEVLASNNMSHVTTKPT